MSSSTNDQGFHTLYDNGKFLYYITDHHLYYIFLDISETEPENTYCF